MPEAPDVELYRRRFDNDGLHRGIETVHFRGADRVLKTSASTIRRHLKGREFVETHRHGKWLFAAVDREGWLALHFGMTGELWVCDAGEQVPEHTKMQVDYYDGDVLAYVNIRQLGGIDWVDELDRFIGDHELGPDVYRVGRDEFVERIGGRRGKLKSALMNQSAIAGLGNVYADELLFQTGVHPETKATEPGEEKLGEMYDAMQRILETVPDHLPELTGLRGSYLVAHRDDDEPSCPRCGVGLEKMKVSGRTTWFCPRHQVHS